jgi:hypothetical protein
MGAAIVAALVSLAVAPSDVPYPVPPAGDPLRVAFVGQRTFFEACALGNVLPKVRTTFLEFRKGGDAEALVAGLERFRPHAVVVFRPEIIPAGAFSGLRAATLGFLTEPIPRGAGAGHPDQQRRLWELNQVDRGNFDRVVSFDPLIAETAEQALPVWRSLPLPVADRFYAPVARRLHGPARVLFVGRSTPHRERLLEPAKHLYDVVHMAFGVDAEALEALMREHDVGINLHNEPYLSFENRVSLHLAAGHLVLSEPLSPLHGLEPGIDFVEVDTPGWIARTIEVLRRYPGSYHAVRVRGRHKAESFRASRVYPRLVADLFDDLSAFGTERA